MNENAKDIEIIEEAENDGKLFFNPYGNSFNKNNPSNLLNEMGGNKTNSCLFRDEIIHEVFSILISETKPNALLVGPAGSGKTHIAEEIARRIKRKGKNVPTNLHGYKVYSLNLADLVAGCSLVGELEGKTKSLLNYLEKEDSKVILFIDEIHMLGESRDNIYSKVAQIFKPALSRGKFMVIGATTTQEVKKLENDPAFNRRFTRVLVSELNREQTQTLLKKAVKGMEKHYYAKIKFNAEIADLIVRTADEFCSVGSHRPDNALTLLDRVVANAIMFKPNDVEAYVELTKDFIEDTAFRMTSGNSIKRSFNETDFRKALKHLFGQDDVIDEIIRTLKLYDLHLRPKKRPLTLLFAGPSGVGKSQIAKIISEEYIGEKPIILNMTEYSSSDSINKIIGAPPGYTGSDSNRELPFDALDTNPYQVIILDEFEKCHTAVQRLFMSAFEDGIITNNFGKEIDFTKAIIIATTNAECAKRIGIANENKSKVLSTSDLSEYFDVELLSRFSNKYTFHPIDLSAYNKIVEDILNLELNEIALGRLGENVANHLRSSISDEDIKHLSNQSFDSKLGARPALTVVRDFIDDLILDKIGEVTS